MPSSSAGEAGSPRRTPNAIGSPSSRPGTRRHHSRRTPSCVSNWPRHSAPKVRRSRMRSPILPVRTPRSSRKFVPRSIVSSPRRTRQTLGPDDTARPRVWTSDRASPRRTHQGRPMTEDEHAAEWEALTAADGKDGAQADITDEDKLAAEWAGALEPDGDDEGAEGDSASSDASTEADEPTAI